MNKADQAELAGLHGTVARVLADQLSETIEIEEDGETKVVHTAAPALIAQAIKFLKDNDITATVEDDDNLSELEDIIKRKREKRSLRLVAGDKE